METNRVTRSTACRSVSAPPCPASGVYHCLKRQCYNTPFENERGLYASRLVASLCPVARRA
eukprot:544694-Pyramimonas_sp.AAC.4